MLMEDAPAEAEDVINHFNMMAKGGETMNLPMILPL